MKHSGTRQRRRARPGKPSSRAIFAGGGRCWVRTSVGLADGLQGAPDQDHILTAGCGNTNSEGVEQLAQPLLNRIRRSSPGMSGSSWLSPHPFPAYARGPRRHGRQRPAAHAALTDSCRNWLSASRNDAVGPSEVEVVPDDLLEEDPPGHRLIQHLGQGELCLQDVIPVARGPVGGAEGVRQPGQLLDELEDVVWDGRASRWAGAGPFSLDQAPVPGKQGSWGHEPVVAEAGGQQPCQGGEYGAVSPVWLRPGDLAAQYGDLRTEHQDLCILDAVASSEECQPREDRGHGQGDEADRK